MRNPLSRRNRSDGATAGAAFGALLAEPTKRSAHIKSYPFVDHYRGMPNRWVLHYRKGDLVDSGPGLAFFFREINTAIAEVHTDDQEVQFVFQGRSSDFQDVTVNGVVSYRIANAELAAARIDFTIDLDTGTYRTEPRNKIESLLTQLVQAAVWEYLAGQTLETLVATGLAEVRTRVAAALTDAPELTELGLRVVSTTISSLKARADVEKALQTPALETLQEKADQATFDRRAKAVEKEQAIETAELDNQINQATRQAELVERENANAVERARGQVEAAAVTTLGQVENRRVVAEVDAEVIRLEGEATAAAEQAKMDVVKEIDPVVLVALALGTIGENIGGLTHLTLTSLDEIVGRLNLKND